MNSPVPTVLLQRDGFLFIAKPPGVSSTRERDGQGRTVVELVTATLGLPSPVRLCHRLDQGTSGVMLLALDAQAQRLASAEFEKHRVRKSYLALCTGRVEGMRVVDAPLGPDPHAPRHNRGRQAVTAEGKPARTVVLGLWTNGSHSLVGARPSTGRTHQVRAHLSHAGHPLLGDTGYGGPPAPRAMLHATFLALRVQRLDLQAGTPPWPDFLEALHALGGTAPGPEEVDRALTVAAQGGWRRPAAGGQPSIT